MFLISSSALGIIPLGREGGGEIFTLFLFFHLKFSAISKTPTKEGTEDNESQFMLEAQP